MSKYVEVSNVSGNIVIDDMYRNLCLKRKIKLRDIRTSEGRHTVMLNDDELLIGVGNPKKNLIRAAVIFIEPQKAEIIPYTISQDDNIVPDPEDYDDVYIYVWGFYTGESGSTGLEIYNNQGDIIFSSNMKPLNIVFCGHNNLPGSNIFRPNRRYCIIQCTSTFLFNAPRSISESGLGFIELFIMSTSYRTFACLTPQGMRYIGYDVLGLPTEMYDKIPVRSEANNDGEIWDAIPYGDTVYLVSDVTNY